MLKFEGKHQKINFGQVLKGSALIFFPLILAFIAVSIFFYYIDLHQERRILENNQRFILEQFKEQVEHEFEHIKSDLIYLTNHHEFDTFFSGKKDALHHLTESFSLFQIKRRYTIRLGF